MIENIVTDSIKNKTAKTCYAHLGGRLGAMLLLHFVRQGWLVKQNQEDKNYAFTQKGLEGFSEMGIDLSALK